MAGSAALAAANPWYPTRAFHAKLSRSLLRAVYRAARETSPDTGDLLLRAARALRADDRRDAVRILDRAWRCASLAAAQTLAPIYGRLLMLCAEDFSAALNMLSRADGSEPHPDVAALTALALLLLKRPDEACRRLEAGLAAYCVVRRGLLADVAGHFLRHPDLKLPGWFGRGPTLALVGELSATEPLNTLDVRADAGTSITRIVRTVPATGQRHFALAAPASDPHAAMHAACRGMRLLGSGGRIPREFALDGRADFDGRRLKVWASLGWRPDHPLRIRIDDGLQPSRELLLDRERGLRPRAPCSLPIPRVADVERLLICAQLPDGRWQPLPDAPLLLSSAADGLAERRRRLRKGPGSRKRPEQRAMLSAAPGTDVVIPVHGERELSLTCIATVLATVDEATGVVVVDDASDDPELLAGLNELARNGRITLMRNAENLGFAASANRALASNPTRDVVLLNSDCQVHGDWLPRLRAAAYAEASVGTVTPLTNNGSITSYPYADGAALDPRDAAEIHEAAAAIHAGVRMDLPVGVGFCLYLRRDCIDDVGTLASDLFGKGYGEETDFCLRARRRGWLHRLAADVFVYHAAGRSFGTRRHALLDRSRRLLNLRYPGFDRYITSYLARGPLHGCRRRLDEHRLISANHRLVLIISPGRSGGVARYVEERCRSLRARGLVPLLLTAEHADGARRCILNTDAMAVPNLQYALPNEFPALADLLPRLRLQSVEIQHFLDLDPRIVALVTRLQIPYDVVLHDYAWICPRITLIDGTGKYCGEPALRACNACVRASGSKLGEDISVSALRERSAAWLHAARRVTVPSADTAARFQRYFPGLTLHVQAHSAAPAAAAGPDAVAAAHPAQPTPRTSRRANPALLRVALIGAIGTHKGYEILLACARDARDRKLPIEFIVIGYTQDDAPLIATGKVFVTGRFSDSEAAHLLRREQPDIAWFPSVWPETWCYALDHALHANLPVVAFDLGAIAERLQNHGRSQCLPMNLEPPALNDALRRFAESAAEANRHLPAITALRTEETCMKTSSPTPNQTPEQPRDDALSASVQMLQLPIGLYLFSVKAAGPLRTEAGDLLALPAMHVGLGPGGTPDQVEFMTGPVTRDAWLFAATDQLIVKVKAPGTKLCLTSVRAPGGSVLSICVERLNSRSEANAAQAAANAPSPEPRAAKAAMPAAAAGGDLQLSIAAHIRTRGDMLFKSQDWAGRVGPGLWIEAFSIQSHGKFRAGDIEYKGLTGSGFETQWTSNEAMCGTQGIAVPLLGFAIRLKNKDAISSYICEYSGYFQSGTIIGPLHDGAPCRSTVANDPLEGIMLRVMRRPSLPETPAKAKAKKTGVKTTAADPAVPAQAGVALANLRPAARGP